MRGELVGGVFHVPLLYSVIRAVIQTIILLLHCNAFLVLVADFLKVVQRLEYVSTDRLFHGRSCAIVAECKISMR